jgi:tetratricopeptide (TPR) repeat protein
MKGFRQLLYFFILFILALSCARDKDRFINRSYHNTTSRYNGYFNAKEIMRETNIGLEQNRDEQWHEVLPIFLYPDESNAQNFYPQMDMIIEKTSVVIKNHSMKIKGEEKCKWIDDSYFLMGQAYFYKNDWYEAAKTFEFVSKEYKKNPIRFPALLWLAKTHIAQENWEKALKYIDILEAEGSNLPEDLQAQVKLAHADYFLKQERYVEAIDQLKEALPLIKPKRRRARPTFIIAQCYDELNQSQRANGYFTDVINLNTPYEMEFYARLKRAKAINIRSNLEPKEELMSMLKDEKNVEWRDQIYYALGDIEFRERNEPLALDYFTLSTTVPFASNRQKGISFLRLADIHFDKKIFETAQSYYDSTLMFIDERHQRFEEITVRSESLTELVENLNIVSREDSLQRLAKMDSLELDAFIEKMIEDMLEEQRKVKEEEERKQTLAMAGAQPGRRGQEAARWYFSSMQTVASGFSEFRKMWGERKLEDNWRRKNKQEVSFDSFEDEEDEEGDMAGGFMDKSKYLKDIPFEEEEFQTSLDKLTEALYNAGLIYKERLLDNDQAAKTFHKLVDDYEVGEYTLPALYQLYRIYTTENNTSKAEPIKERILSEFANTDYARLIINPDYKKEEEAAKLRDSDGYNEVYMMYRRKMYSGVIEASNNVIENQPDNYFLSKYYLLKALSIGNRQHYGDLEGTLEAIIEKFPETEEAEIAEEMLGKLRKDRPKKQEEKEEKKEKKDSPYKFEPESNHYFIMIIPKEGVNINLIKGNISNYNSEFHRNANLKTSNTFIGLENYMIMVKSFENNLKALQYLKDFKKNETKLKDINDKGYQMFVMSDKNFSPFFQDKDIEGYQEFFEEFYK